MRNSRIGLGIFLLTIGIIMLLINAHIIDATIIYGLYMLWPLILIAIGVRVIFKGNMLVRTISWLTFLAILITFSYVNHDKVNFGGPIESRQYSVERTAETKTGDLKLDMGGVSLDINSTGSKLLSADIHSNGITNTYNLSENKDNAEFKFKRDDIKFILPDFYGKQDCSFLLNKDVTWGIDINSGMSSVDFDASDLKISKININSGFVKLNLTLGNKNSMTEINASSGFSDFNINVPKESGVKIFIDGGLNSRDFSGLSLNRKGNYYITDNYSSASSKIYIKVNLGLSKLRVSAY